MRTAFADTSFFVALLNERDEAHASAMVYASDRLLQVVTTSWVLLELGNWFATGKGRSRVQPYIEFLSHQPRVTLVPADEQRFRSGLVLYAERPDKAWSLTDCISFVVMQEHGVSEALTADHHFEQAGFRALLRQADSPG